MTEPNTHALLAWVGAQRVHVAADDYGGLGLFAATDVEPGAELLRCSVDCLLHAQAARSSRIGPRLQTLRAELANGDDLLDDRVMCQLALLHHRRLGAESAWAGSDKIGSHFEVGMLRT